MTIVKASAPGKALLCGEYVVLDGAPAVSLALNRRAIVTIAESSRKLHCLRATGYVSGEHGFDPDAEGELRWEQPANAGAFRLFEQVWQRFAPSSQPRLSICMDSSAFMDSDGKQKLGLGSSAAVAVALAMALNACSRKSADVATDVRNAHLDFQRGRGSGADVATSLQGGLILFNTGPATKATSLAWPAGLFCRFLYSGVASSTTQHIERYRTGPHSASARQSRQNLRQIAADVAARWVSGDARMVLQALDTYVAALTEFSDDFDLRVFAAGHAEMVHLAAKHGIVYKPCGAGGGDIGAAFSLDENGLDGYCKAARMLGFDTLDIAPDWRGGVVETERLN